MPTGYTSQIENGKVKTFTQFAKVCVRAFGEAIHMRDEPLYKPYRPMEVSAYHLEELTVCRDELESLKNMTSSKNLVKKKRIKLREDIDQYENTIAKKKADKKIVIEMLREAKKWTPPTDEHLDFKQFVIKQLEIAFEEGNTSYHERTLEAKKKQMESLDGDTIIKERISKLEEDIIYHQTTLTEETVWCETSNKWVKDLFNSVEGVEV